MVFVLTTISLTADAAQKTVSKIRGGAKKMEITIKSTSFEDGAMIPKKYTCDGDNVSPPLSWTSGPATTKTYAIICDDPDAPFGTWVHWVIFNIPANVKELPENVAKFKLLANGAVQGWDSAHQLGYQGPCPPSGTHRYIFRIFALDVRMRLPPGSSAAELQKNIEGHILAKGQLTGRYKRSGK